MQDHHHLEERISCLSPLQKKWLANQLTVHSQASSSSDKLVACVKTSHSVSTEELKATVRSRMPSHCVPQAIYCVENFPRKAEGKIDRGALQSFVWQFQTSFLNTPDTDLDESDEQDDYFVDFVAPRNVTEQTLAEIWQNVLGMSEISIHDDFLEVGGDSLLSIRIIARANKAGLTISPQDFFDLPTIAQQAERVKQASTVTLVQEQTVTGKFNLTPIQRWFFQRVNQQQHHWHQNILLQVADTYTFPVIENALELLLLHHDVLRSKFVFQEEKWQQQIQALNPLLPIQRLDLRDYAETDIAGELLRQTDLLHAAMSLDFTGLIQFLFIQMPNDSDNKLLIIAHHLIIDAESWRILLEDLYRCLQASQQQQKPALDNKTHSIKLWSERLEQLGQQQEWQSQLPFWQKQLQNVECPFPTDFNTPIADNLAGSQNTYNQVFSVAETQTILSQLKKREVSIQKGLIDALVTSLWQWSQQSSLVIDIETHGRAALFADLDLSRSVGWFTAYYPVVFSQPADQNEWSRSIASSLDSIPKNGIGYGVLRELYRDDTLLNHENAKICFNYLGQLDKLSSVSQSGELKVEKENIGSPKGPLGPRTHLLEINAMIRDQKLVINWAYSDRFHQQSSLVKIGSLFAKALTKSTAHNLEQPATGQDKTFDLVDLDNEEMDNLANILSQLDDQ